MESKRSRKDWKSWSLNLDFSFYYVFRIRCIKKVWNYKSQKAKFAKNEKIYEWIIGWLNSCTRLSLKSFRWDENLKRWNHLIIKSFYCRNYPKNLNINFIWQRLVKNCWKSNWFLQNFRREIKTGDSKSTKFIFKWYAWYVLWGPKMCSLW